MKNLPDWLLKTDYSKLKKQLNDFYAGKNNNIHYFQGLEEYDPRQLSKMCHIECFQYDMLSFLSAGEIKEEKTYILFNYYYKVNKDKAGNCAYYKIKL